MRINFLSHIFSNYNCTRTLTIDEEIYIPISMTFFNSSLVNRRPIIQYQRAGHVVSGNVNIRGIFSGTLTRPFLRMFGQTDALKRSTARDYPPRTINFFFFENLFENLINYLTTFSAKTRFLYTFRLILPSLLSDDPYIPRNIRLGI